MRQRVNVRACVCVSVHLFDGILRYRNCKLREKEKTEEEEKKRRAGTWTFFRHFFLQSIKGV